MALRRALPVIGRGSRSLLVAPRRSAVIGGKEAPAAEEVHMFCYQCEQTRETGGCVDIGICGKEASVATLQDAIVEYVKRLCVITTKMRVDGLEVPPPVNALVLESLFSTLTNVNFSVSRMEDYCRQLVEAINDLDPSANVSSDDMADVGHEANILHRYETVDASVVGLQELLVYGIKGTAAYTDHALQFGRESEEIHSFIQEAMGFLLSDQANELGEVLNMVLRCGEANLKAMALLEESNKSLGTPTPTDVPCRPQPGPAILVSGHDLHILHQLLEQTQGTGVNVYTHGELLPAHSYPTLKAFDHLVAHYGSAWQRQKAEFSKFPGPIVMTTNCVMPPPKGYSSRLFTTSSVGCGGDVPHVVNNDFSEVIAMAKEMEGFHGNMTEYGFRQPLRALPKELTIGYGKDTILGAAPAVLEAIAAGQLQRLFLVGGCDGTEYERSYYSKLTDALPQEAAVITLGCAKFRINRGEMGTIGDTGIPRILDMGQCNDAYGAIQVALALANALECSVADLPLTIVLSWFEQKAVAVLLSLLHLGIKPIHIGPRLPMFITPEVLNVLTDQFGIQPIGDADVDLKQMLAAKGMS